MKTGFNGEPTPHQIGPDFAELNRIAEASNAEMARELRATVIRLAYETFVRFLDADRETEQLLRDSGYPEGKNPSTYLMMDMLASPNRNPHDLQNALTYLMVRKKDDDHVNEVDFDRIHVSLPVPDDFVLGPDAPDLQPVNENRGIWVELEKTLPYGAKRTRRFAITGSDVTEYAALPDPASEFVQDSIEIRAQADEMADLQRWNQAMLAQLLENHSHFRAVYQPYEG